jgi:branched-chain amino acid transport system permease protein
MSITLIFEATVLGILSGGIYALMATGLTLTFGVMHIINVAQGILVILGAYLSFYLESTFHVDLFVGLLFTMPCMFVLGVCIERAFIRGLKRDRVALSVLVTFAVALVIEGALTMIFSGTLTSLQAWYVVAAFRVGDFYLPYIYVFSFVLSLILLTGLSLLVYRTQFGYALRAVVQNPTAAALVGVDIGRVQSITFGLGTALTAAGGMAFGATNAFNPASSYDLISRLLVIIVLGGMGSLEGALIASVVMLVIGDITSVVWSPVWSSTVFFAFLIVLLMFRPQGLLGRRMGRTA